ncbi:hypothetical protein TNCV_4548731 [Trichonephila clavipes]|nr:hypothetical protein TNCV_4548731 [Trichonephila clavipes]
MVGKDFVWRWVALFTRAFKETDMYYCNHLSCHHPQRSMERFTNTELVDMPLIYGLAEGNARAAERLYRKRLPQRVAPDLRMYAFIIICVNIGHY